jgi:hypothetical protein
MKEARKSLTVLLVSLLVSVTAAVTDPDRSLGGFISYNVDVVYNGQTGFLPQFDPSLGSLTSVTYSGNVGVFNDFLFDQLQSSVSYDAAAQFDLVLFGALETSFSGGNQLGTLSFNPPTYSAQISANVSESGSLDVASYFYGTRLINVQVGPNISVDVPATGLQGKGFQGANGTLTFTYTYAVVPEPPGLVLASISALLPLYLIVRRRFTKRAGCV